LQREKFEPREEFEIKELSGVIARIWYSPKIARWKVEEGAKPLKDGAALSERPVGSEEWLIGEILSDRGESVVLEPEDLRERVGRRARELAKEMKVSRVAASASAKA
jgi:predicted DNA-binding transcriptional regulator YafY